MSASTKRRKPLKKQRFTHGRLKTIMQEDSATGQVSACATAALSSASVWEAQLTRCGGVSRGQAYIVLALRRWWTFGL